VGYCLEMSTGDMRRVMRLLTAVELTPEQERRAALTREHCVEQDADHRHQGINLDVCVTQALDELLAGTLTASEGPAYTYAFHQLVAGFFSDTTDLGVWREPSWFYSMDEELAVHGVAPELRPGSFLFNGPPIRLPHPGDAFPSIGIFRADRAAPLADAYESVLHRLSPDYRDTAARFAELMRFEAEEWKSAKRMGQTPDTILFWCS
jgi:hypothetical protein